MLAPDIATTEQTVHTSFKAASLVSIYAAAMRYQVSPLLGLSLPGWFGPIKADLETAIGHARTWQDDLCIQLNATIPNTLIDYGSTFKAVGDQLLNIATEIELSGQGASPEQRKNTLELLGGLVDALGTEIGRMSDLQKRVVALMDQIQQDHTNIAGAITTINQQIPNGGATSQTIQAQLGNDFLDAQIQEPCSVSLRIKQDIDIQIRQSAGTYTELLPYAIAVKVLEKVQTDNEVATKALSAVTASWQFMQDLVQDVVTDLQTATDDQVLPIIQQAEIDAAQQVWTQLMAFAQSLVTAPFAPSTGTMS